MHLQEGQYATLYTQQLGRTIHPTGSVWVTRVTMEIFQFHSHAVGLGMEQTNPLDPVVAISRKMATDHYDITIVDTSLVEQ